MQNRSRLSRDELHFAVRDHHALEILELRERVADLQQSQSVLMEINVNLVEAQETIIGQRDQARRALAQLTESLGFHADDRGYTVSSSAAHLPAAKASSKYTSELGTRRSQRAPRRRASLARETVQ
jgi:hypothetical protein